jgi:phosphatidylserine/phosphatidylglycerophosphate/cardiolipin synthase-like enzyme
MTMNATQSSPTANREYLALDTDPADVAEIEAIFEHDYANHGYHATGKLVVSPDNSSGKLTTLIGMAKSTIDIEAEELSDTGTVSALAAAAGKGVIVHVVVADAQTPSAAALTTLKGAGVKLNVFSQYYVHAKSMVVDGKYAYVGSVNYSAGSIGYNREVGVITDNAAEVQKVESTTTSDFAAGSPL